MDIKPPIGVDSLGKLNEWLDECGMPFIESKPLPGLAWHENSGTSCVAIEHEAWSHGFAFDRDNRDEANRGYRDLVVFYAKAFYGRFSACEDGTRIFFRVRPELSEEEQTITTNLDGSPVDWDWYEALDDDARPELRTEFTGRRIGKMYCRLAFVPPPLKPPKD